MSVHAGVFLLLEVIAKGVRSHGDNGNASLRLVGQGTNLSTRLATKKAFDAAHSLKGVLGNLSLTPIYTPVAEITELLRRETDMDYKSRLDTILEKKDELDKLCAD